MSKSLRSASSSRAPDTARLARLLLAGASLTALTAILPVFAQQPPPTPEELKKRQQQQQQQQGGPQQKPQHSPQQKSQQPGGNRPPQANTTPPVKGPGAPQKNVVNPPPPPAPKGVPPTIPPKAATQTPPPNIKTAPPPTGRVINPTTSPTGTPGQPKVIGTPGGTPGTAPKGAPGSVPGVKAGVPKVGAGTPGGPSAPGAPPKSSIPGVPGGPGAIPKPSVSGATGGPGAPGVSPKGATPAPVTPPVIGRPVVGKVLPPPKGPTTLTQIQAQRVVKTDASGRQITTEPGNRTIVRQNNTTIIRRNETTVVNNFYPSARSVPRPGGITETFYVRPDGMRVFTETDRNGRIVRRYGRPPHGPEVVFVDNRRFYRNLAIGVGVGIVALAIAAPVISMPRERYIVDYDRASDDDIYVTLTAPPVMRLERAYSLDEIRYSQPLRDRMPRVDLDTINFDFGSFVVTEDQYPKLERIARAMARAIQANPAEQYLIEGHTDAVGSSEDNLSLSDRRAEAIQRVLVEYYQIPLENLVTQGYGEQFLKVPTQGPERANRRAAVRRITPLLSGN